jgi:hypothetical protein
MSPYMQVVLGYLQRTGCSLTQIQCERLFGCPPGTSVEVLFDAQVEAGLMQVQRIGKVLKYRARSATPRPKPSPATFAHIGRDAARVASVWQFAQGRGA